MLKTELHAHTSADPQDYIPYSTTDFIDRAAELGYQALAVTLHDACFDVDPLRRYASDRGITLIDGIERLIEGKHVLLLNFGPSVEKVDTFKALAELKRARPAGLVIAPHPFYPTGVCLGSLLDRHTELFDAVEVNAFYTRVFTQFNDAAIKWARAHEKPLVGNGDIHRLRQLGKTYSLVDAAPDPDAICSAIKEGKVEFRTAPLSTVEATAHLADLVVSQLFKSPKRGAGSLVSPSAAEASTS